MLIINLFYEFSINHVSDANMSEMDAIIAAVSNDVNTNYDDEKKYKRNAKVCFLCISSISFPNEPLIS